MAEKRGTELANINSFSEETLNKLAPFWITTAEEFSEIARQDGGIQNLSDTLEISQEEVTSLAEQAVSNLPDDISYITNNYISYGLGALDERDDNDIEDEPVFFGETVPETVDFRQKSGPIRNQGQRGTCVAFATIALREILFEQNKRIPLSQQLQYWHCKQRDGSPTSEGTYLKIGMDVLKEYGACIEKLWPYNLKRIKNNESQGPPPKLSIKFAKKYRISGSKNLHPTWVNELRALLASEHPIAFVVPVYTYWFNQFISMSGDIRMPLPFESKNDKEGQHAMCMVGYTDDLDVPGGGYFLVRNSWGSNWAKNSMIEPGYARIPYAYIREYAVSAFTST